MEVIWGKGEAGYFLGQGWTGRNTLIWLGKLGSGNGRNAPWVENVASDDSPGGPGIPSMAAALGTTGKPEIK